MGRISRDALFMDIATTVSERSTCPRKHVGAVIVRDNRIISMGYNGAPRGMPHCTDVGCGGGVKRSTTKTARGYGYDILPDEFPNGCTRAIHAELNAVAFSARQGQATDGAVMYSTVATCVACAQALIAAGITGFVYLEPYRIMDGIHLLAQAGVVIDIWTP